MTGTKLTDLDTAQTIIPNDTAPEGIIQIQDHAFFHCTPKGLHHVHHTFGNSRKRIYRNRHFRDVIELGVGKISPAAGNLNGVQINDIDVFDLLTALHQQIIQLPLLKQEGARNLISILSKAAIVHQREIALEDIYRAMGIDLLPNPTDAPIGILRKACPAVYRESAKGFI